MDNKKIINFFTNYYFFKLIISYIFDKEMKIGKKYLLIKDLFEIKSYAEFDCSPFNLSSTIKKLKPIIMLINYIEGYFTLVSITKKRYRHNTEYLHHIIKKLVYEAKVTELNIKNTHISIDIYNDILSLTYVTDDEIDDIEDVYQNGSLLVYKDYFDLLGIYDDKEPIYFVNKNNMETLFKELKLDMSTDNLETYIFVYVSEEKKYEFRIVVLLICY